VGEGPDREEFEKLSADLRVTDRVTFAGHAEDPLPFYQHVFDVAVLPSRSEAMGLAALEAEACGLPTIGSDAGGTPEAVLDGESGVIFPTDDHAALARHIQAFVDDPAFRVRTGQRAREIALEQFTLEKQFEQIDEVVSELLQSRTR
jgi:glycosyltransferase involved in cell wall biosynthesis